MKTYFFLCCILWSYSSFSQTEKELDKLYIHARELANEDSNKSMSLCVDLKNKAEKIHYQEMIVKSYYLLGFNYYLKGEADKVYENSHKAFILADKIHYLEGKALALRLLGTQYAKLGLLEKSKNELNNALDLISKSESEEANEIRGMIYNSLLILMNDNEDVEKKITIAQKSIFEYNKLKHEERRNELLVSAYTNLGYLFSKVQKYDSAQFSFKEAINRVQKNNHYLKAAIYHDMADSFHRQNQMDSAISNYKIALSFSATSDFNLKRLEILDKLANVYLSENDTANYMIFLEKHMNLKDSIDSKKLETIDSMILDSEKNIKTLERNKKGFYIITIALSVGIMMMMSLLISLNNKRKKQRKQFDELIKKWESQDFEVSNEVMELNTDLVIIEETERRILNELNNFEKSVHFNDKEITLYKLANQINTNTKYLSSIIKKHKHKNFNNYINELRIHFIVDKLRNDPKYVQYKISHLAEEAGFSSHSAFSSVFHQIMGINPSVFIKYLKEAKNI